MAIISLRKLPRVLAGPEISVPSSNPRDSRPAHSNKWEYAVPLQASSGPLSGDLPQPAGVFPTPSQEGWERSATLLLFKNHTPVLENLISSLSLERKDFCERSQPDPCLESKMRKRFSFPSLAFGHKGLVPQKQHFLF